MEFPEQLRYTKEHEWVRVEGEEVVFGITDFAQDQLGDIVYIELPEPGASLERMDAFGSVEAVKTVSDLYAPVSCEVVAVNEALTDDPGLVNSSPYGDGWMVRAKLGDAAQLDELLSAGAYQELVAELGG